MQDSRREPSLFWWCSAALLLGACGGRVEPDHDVPSPSQTTATSSPGSASGSTGGFDSTLPLGECVEGWFPSQGDCPWLAGNGRCYATKAEACACVCPRDRSSTCVSGLPGGADSRTRVTCN